MIRDLAEGHDDAGLGWHAAAVAAGGGASWNDGDPLAVRQLGQEDEVLEALRLDDGVGQVVDHHLDDIGKAGHVARIDDPLIPVEANSVAGKSLECGFHSFVHDGSPFRGSQKGRSDMVQSGSGYAFPAL
ncbi:MAG TPA: hypothetical protein VGL40_15580 [Bacillota bacterium]